MLTKFATISIVALGLLALPLAGQAADELEFDVSGTTFAAYGQTVEAYGQTITATVAGVPAGTYTIEIEAAEYYCGREGQRIMDIRCKGQVIAAGVDLFKMAGGKGKPVVIKGTVEHRGDAIGGAITITLQGQVENAKFDFIRIRNAQGTMIANLSAKALKLGAQGWGVKIPEIKDPPTWNDPARKPAERADDLLRRLSLQEKISQLCMESPGIDRLGIHPYDWWNEALHGVARAGYATQFPQPVGMAASFHPEMVQQVFDAVSTEALAKHWEAVRQKDFGRYTGLTMWTPNINLFRDPRWGRGHESYGEDPYLLGRMGIAVVKGLQGPDREKPKTIATLKHYAVHSGPESTRHKINAQPTPRDLWESYLPHFEMGIREGGAWSVMGAYNRVNGFPCCASPFLLEQTLRQRWGFDGIVVSDVGATNDMFAGYGHKWATNREEACVKSLKAGLDNDSGHFVSLLAAVRKKEVTEAEIDRAAKRCFEARFRLGLLDPASPADPRTQIPLSVVGGDVHDRLALQVAREGMTLLKNDKHLLPFDAAKVRKVVVLGPNGNSVPVLYGNYNGNLPRATTVADGVRKLVGAGKVTVLAGGDMGEWTDGRTLVPDIFLTADGQPGLKAEYWLSNDFKGEPFLVRNEGRIAFRWFVTPHLAGMKNGPMSVRWTGTFTAPLDGKYGFSFDCGGQLKTFVDEVAAADGKHFAIEARKGQSVSLRIEMSGSNHAFFKWDRRDLDALANAQVAAFCADADAVIYAGGISGEIESEEGEVACNYKGCANGDRDNIEMPAPQTQLLKTVLAANRRLVLVNFSGGCVAMPWEAKNVPAILQAWYPGQQGGQAVADTVFGLNNPAGRLPITFYAATSDLPAFDDYAMKGRTYRFCEKKPLWAFGHGLSYSRFAYSGAKAPRTIAPAGTIPFEVTVKNTGKRDGDEVVQVYWRQARRPDPETPLRNLCGIRRITLKAGETQTVKFSIPATAFRRWDEARQEYVVLPGDYVLEAGPASDNLPLQAKVKVPAGK
jgi:beta-glucosidase